MTQSFTGKLTSADHKSHIPVSFEVPEGTTRLTISIETSPVRASGALFDNMVCLSLFGPKGARGARHNNPDRTIIIEATYASPGYVSGPIEPGEWTVFMDTFRVLGPDPLNWEISVNIETDPIEEKVPFTEPLLAETGPGWYRGDLHAHSLHSDADWEIADLVNWAKKRGLDFVTLTDHNTVSGHAEALSLADDTLLTMGGVELTTHYGHALTLGERQWQEWRPGTVSGMSMPNIAESVIQRGGTYIIAHPKSPGDPACTGCRWEYEDMMPGPAKIVEIWNGGVWADYNEDGLALFYDWLKQGHRLVATAGTDNHGEDDVTSDFGFNHVFATSRTESAILEAVRAGRNYLSVGPKLILTATDHMGNSIPMGGTAENPSSIQVEWSTESEPLTLHFISADGNFGSKSLSENTDGTEKSDLMPNGFVMVELRDSKNRLAAITNPIFIA